MYCQYIQLIHPLRYIHFICTLWYPLHKYLLMEQVNLHHHHINHHQKVWHLKVILRHTTTHPIRYRAYQLTRIRIQLHQIILHRIHLTHHTTIILNKDDVQKRLKINARVKQFSWPYQKVHKAYSQPHYSRLQIKERKVQIGWGSTTVPSLFTIFHELT